MLWAEYLTAQELFEAITPPKKFHFLGKYQIFLKIELTKKLQSYDVLDSLRWLENQGVRCFGHPFEKLGDQIISKAWEHFEEPRIAEAFAKVALVQWREHQSLLTRDEEVSRNFHSSLTQEQEKRRKLIEQAMLIVSESGEEPWFLFGSLRKGFIDSGDFCWCIERLETLCDSASQRTWVQLIQNIFSYQDTQSVVALLEVIKTNELLQQSFQFDLEPVELNSDRAMQMKASYTTSQRLLNPPQPPLLEPLPTERVLQLLTQLESGNLSAWWELNREMLLKPTSQYYDGEFELDLTKLSGWQEAEEATRSRIIEGAKKYVQEQNDIDYEWIGTNTFDRPAVAGCRALQLLLKESTDFLESLSPGIWEKWAPVIVAVPSSSQHEAPYLEIVKRAYQHEPQVSIRTLMTLIDKENQDHDYIFSVHRFDACWDERLKLALLEKAKEPQLKPSCMGELIEELLKQGLAEARDFAQALIPSSVPLSEHEAEKTLVAARLLIGNAEPSSWVAIWSLVQQDPAFGRKILESSACRYSRGIQLNLTEVQLADLYIWLVRQYPYDEDPDHSNEVLAHHVTDREEMANFRDRVVLYELRTRGTLQACAELQRIVQVFPETTWLKKVLIESQINMRRTSWKAPSPSDLLQLILVQEPPNSALSNQLEELNQRTQKMADDPKIDKSVHISNSKNIRDINTGDSNTRFTLPETQTGLDWKFWLGLVVTVIGIMLSMAASGVFNDEIRKWFIKPEPSPPVEKKLDKQTD
jgi:hypothetical protein